MHPLPYYNSFRCDQIENLVLATSPQTYDGKVDVLSSLVTCDNWVLERKKQKKNHVLIFNIFMVNNETKITYL